MSDDPAVEDPHAPKGEIALARAALLRFGDDSSPAHCTDLADGCLKMVGRQYNIELTRPNHQAGRRALANVAATARAYANALRDLDQIMPGYLNINALMRLPDGRIRPTTFGPLPLEPLRESPGRDDFWKALEPELELPMEARPKNALRPTRERAEAMARLFADHRKSYKGDLIEKGPGNWNGDRDGRTSKRMLAEVCYLIVAGCFGRAGAEKISSTPASRAMHRLSGPDSVPLFAGFVRAMHMYARGSDVPESSLEGSVREAAMAMRAYVAEHPELYGFMTREATEQATAAKGVYTFLRFLTNPAARPVLAKSTAQPARRRKPKRRWR